MFNDDLFAKNNQYVLVFDWFLILLIGPWQLQYSVAHPCTSRIQILVTHPIKLKLKLNLN